MDEIRIITNHRERKVMDAWELPTDKRAQFDYLDWAAIEDGRDSAQFVSYRGEIYDLSEFSRAPESLRNWDGFSSDSYFSGILVRYARDENEINPEYVIMGRYFA